MAQLEDKTKKAVNKMLKELYPDCWIFMPVQMGMGMHGVPDHIVCVDVEITQEMVGQTFGMFLGIESKTLKGKVSPMQRIQVGKLIQAGAFAHFVFGVEGVEELRMKLIKLFKE